MSRRRLESLKNPNDPACRQAGESQYPGNVKNPISKCKDKLNSWELVIPLALELGHWDF